MSAPDPQADSPVDHDPHGALRASWEANAAAWTQAVRDAAIPSRRAGTDAAVLAACEAALAGRAGAHVLDLGCGEGWLARALATRGAHVLGLDASAALIDAARAASGGSAAGGPAAAEPRACAPVRFDVVDYETLTARDTVAAGPFDLIVCNFALLGDPVAPVLAAVRRRLAVGGRVVIQTVHPWVATGDGTYAEGWRVETFATFATPFPASMPWYFRTLGGWIAALGEGGLRLEVLGEPTHPESGRPLSLLLVCAAA
jgi:2-polyprenyl-3-methyl-5-hydroxy-6-metoxy-1,4-benzoquinol methylase